MIVPTLALIAFVAILVWEILRTNLSAPTLAHYPWKVSLLGISPAASLAGVFGGLLLARSQFARSVRPVIGWGGTWVRPDGAAEQTWIVTVHNGGAGLGIVADVDYQLQFNSEDTRPDHWIGFSDLKERYKQGKLDPGDISIIELGRGNPLASGTRPKDGFEVMRLKESARTKLKVVDMRITIADIVGDLHQRHMVLLTGMQNEYVPHLPAATDTKNVDESHHAAKPAAAQEKSATS